MVVVNPPRVEVDPGHVNPISNGEFTIFTPLDSCNSNNRVFHENLQRPTDNVRC